MKKKGKKRLIYFLIVFISVIYFFNFQNNSLVTTKYNFSSDNIPESFHGYKIVQLSDLHSKSFGDNQSKLVEKVESESPNLIVFTGDLVDSKRYDEQNSLLLMEKLVEIAPVYFVTGNHEWWSRKYDSLEDELKNIGVHILRNTVEEIHYGKDKIQIIGIDDPAKASGYYTEQELVEESIRNSIQQVKVDNSFEILLSHRPELLSVYSQFQIDLVFSGHAHGGQFGIPMIGGLVAPNQGLFPKYYSGKYILEDTTMIVNRGLGNSIIPLRIFNRPEIVVLTLMVR